MKGNALTSFAILYLLFTTFLVGLSLRIIPVKASGTIYIRADGSIDPPTAPISTVDNITYALTGNIYDYIVIERDYIVVDGAGYTVQGTGAMDSRGIDMSGRSNVTIKSMKIMGFHDGVNMTSSVNNSISGNHITNNMYGITFWYSSNNSIIGNNITNNGHGIWLHCSLNNEIYHNNFMGNEYHVYFSPEYTNTWDNGYPSGGNYWSNYSGTDLYGGIYQNETGSDGIGDTPYIINYNNRDRYPIIPEFPQFLILSIFMIAILLTAAAYRRKHI